MDHLGNLQESLFTRTRKRFLELWDRIPLAEANNGGIGETLIDNTGGTPYADGTVPAFSNPPTKAECDNFAASTVATLNRRSEMNPHWSFSGTGAVAASVARDTVMGGILLATGGNPADFTSVHRRNVAGRRLTVGYNTSLRPRMEWIIRTPADITATTLIAALKLTNAMNIGVDNDEIVFRYEAGVNGGRFQISTSSSGADETRDSGVLVEPAMLYRLVAQVGADLRTSFFIASAQIAAGNNLGDERRVGVNLADGNFPPLTANVALLPFVGVRQDGADARTLAVLETGFAQWGVAGVDEENGGGPVV